MALTDSQIRNVSLPIHATDSRMVHMAFTYVSIRTAANTSS